nr:heme-binding domain-containing protein [Flavobacterium sp. K5-23]
MRLYSARKNIDRQHIKEGKENLNFSEWGNYSSRKQGNKLDRIVKQIKSDEMPLSSYTLINKEAILTSAQKAELIQWIEKMKDSISSVN